MDDIIMIPPDGGWGWVIVFGVNIINFCIKPLDASFGLLFGDLLKDLQIETTGAALITSILLAVIYFSGFATGPILRKYSYRKVGVVGGILCSAGLILTVPARSMIHIIITYSFIYGLGISIITPATFMAMNHYFVKRIGLAIGLSLLGGALGNMLFPHAIRFLLEQYGFRSTILLIGSIMLHTLVGSFFMEPAKRHLVRSTDTKSDHQPLLSQANELDNFSKDEKTLLRRKTAPELYIAEENESLRRKSSHGRKLSIANVIEKSRKVSVSSKNSDTTTIDYPGSLHLYLEVASKKSPNTAPIRRTFSQPAEMSPKKINGEVSFDPNADSNYELRNNSHTEPRTSPSKERNTFFKKLILFFDFDLLKDPIFINLIFGISLFYVGDQNFKMLAVFFYENIGYNKKQTAFFLSVQAFADIISRLVLPPLCEKVPLTKRTLFMIAMALLAIVRSVMATQTGYINIIICLALGGFVRGLCVINSSVTLAQYCKLEKLASAYGLHMVSRGVLTITLGPLLGYIRDSFNSYSLCLHLQSCILMLCFIAWTTEYIICWIISRSKNIRKNELL